MNNFCALRLPQLTSSSVVLFSIVWITFAFVQMTVAQTPTEIQAKLPQLSGWTIDKTVEVYHPDNLYDRINGAAPGYILFNFNELTAFEYIKNKNDHDSPYISVQVYRHATDEDAFGIYAAERPSESNYLTVGAQGYQEGSMLNFFVDRLYVKIESPFDDEDVMNAITQIAKEFGLNVNPQPVFPKQLQRFPSENKIEHSESYIATGFLGHEFLSNAFVVKYILEGKKYQLFIIDAGSTELANAMLNKYVQFTKQSLEIREGRLTFTDRFNGDIECLWNRRFIYGIVNENKAPVNVDDILKEAGKTL